MEELQESERGGCRVMATHDEEKRTDKIFMKIKPSLKEKAQQRADAEGRSLSNYIEQLLIKDWNEHNN